jgi:hypothetical protein
VAQKLTKGADVPPPLVHITQLGRIVAESQTIGPLDWLTCGSAQLSRAHDGASSFFRYNVFFYCNKGCICHITIITWYYKWPRLGSR